MIERRLGPIGTRALALTIASGLMTAVATPALAAPVEPSDLGDAIANPAAAIADATAELTASSASHSWKYAEVTRTVSVEGKPGPAVVHKGDVVTYTVTYTDNKFIPDGIISLEDVKPAGFEYVPASATYKDGNKDWADPSTANNWLDTSNGNVVFSTNWAAPWRGKTVTFKWQYRVTDAQPGEYNTGMKMRWQTSSEDLSEMGPVIKVVDKPAAPGPPGNNGFPSLDSPSLGSPSLDSPSLGSLSMDSFGTPGVNADQVQQIFDLGRIGRSNPAK